MKKGTEFQVDHTELGRVRQDLDIARLEVEKLLQMNAQNEQEKAGLDRKLKETTRQLEVH